MNYTEFSPAQSCLSVISGEKDELVSFERQFLQKYPQYRTEIAPCLMHPGFLKKQQPASKLLVSNSPRAQRESLLQKMYIHSDALDIGRIFERAPHALNYRQRLFLTLEYEALTGRREFLLWAGNGEVDEDKIAMFAQWLPKLSKDKCSIVILDVKPDAAELSGALDQAVENMGCHYRAKEGILSRSERNNKSGNSTISSSAASSSTASSSAASSSAASSSTASSSIAHATTASASSASSSSVSASTTPKNQDHSTRASGIYVGPRTDGIKAECKPENKPEPSASVNSAQTLQWYEKAASQGDIEAQMQCGKMYYYGQGTAINYAKAIYWYEKAAEQGNVHAQSICASLYSRDTLLNEKKALFWCEKAAEAGYSPAQFDCAIMYNFGHGTEKNLKKAFYWYEQSAKQGNEYAQFTCGEMCYKGDGTAQDKKKALDWYEKAAERGHAEAQATCGKMYFDGDGTEKDLHKALHWYERAADQGNADMQYACGLMFFNGLGTDVDYEKAIYWYEKAAEQGHKKAQFQCVFAYNTISDIEKADYWLNKFLQ